jgi:hypothetical protein
LSFPEPGQNFPGLADYFASLGKPIELGESLESKIKYPADLKPVINPLGINLAISIGLAMRPS